MPPELIFERVIDGIMGAHAAIILSFNFSLSVPMTLYSQEQGYEMSGFLLQKELLILLSSVIAYDNLVKSQ